MSRQVSCAAARSATRSGHANRTARAIMKVNRERCAVVRTGLTSHPIGRSATPWPHRNSTTVLWPSPPDANHANTPTVKIDVIPPASVEEQPYYNKKDKRWRATVKTLFAGFRVPPIVLTHRLSSDILSSVVSLKAGVTDK